eukprot:RCo020649
MHTAHLFALQWLMDGHRLCSISALYCSLLVALTSALCLWREVFHTSSPPVVASLCETLHSSCDRGFFGADLCAKMMIPLRPAKKKKIGRAAMRGNVKISMV